MKRLRNAFLRAPRAGDGDPCAGEPGTRLTNRRRLEVGTSPLRLRQLVL
ncbi:MAG: hypothetical protein ABSD97_13595 [Acidimicrobiales bacterium]|jgi:hypothetical protein